MTQYDFVVLLNYISVIAALFCIFMLASQRESRMQKLALMVCVCLMVCNVGFLIRIEASTVEALIAGQKLAYLLVTQGMFFMILFLCEYCKFSIPGIIKIICHALNTIITIVVLTLDHHKLFYKDYWIIETDNHFELEKDYGIFHTIVIAVFGIYMLASVVIAVSFSIKNMRKRKNYVWRLLVAVMVPCLAYIIPKVFDLHTDLQPMAFAIFMIMVVGMIYKNALYDVNNIAYEFTVASLDDAFIVMDEKYNFKGCNNKAIEFFPELKDLPLDADIRKNSNELTRIIINEMTEFTRGDQVYSAEVKHIDRSAKASAGIAIWLRNITLQHNYTQLLEAQKEHLKSEVENLSVISYYDELSGIQNRRAYEEKISAYRDSAELPSISLITMDLNRLKEINDTLGHVAGDEQIKAAASLLTEVFGEYGTSYRIGGDEFFTFIEDPAADLNNLIEKFRVMLKDWKGEMSESISLSIGAVRAVDHPGCSIDELMTMSDKAMYSDKRRYYESSGIDRRKITT